MPPIDPAWIALIGTLCGGVGLKVAEHYLNRGSKKSTDATQIRDELRLQIATLNAEIKDLEDERDQYRNQYYELWEKYVAQQTELTIAIEKIRNIAGDAAVVAQQIAEQPPADPKPLTGLPPVP